MTADSRELAYYKRQVDTLAGENLRLEYLISGLRHELRQRKRGFALLSQLHETIGAQQQISTLFSIALPAIGATLGVDKAVVLSPGQGEQSFRVTQSIGFRQEAQLRLASIDFQFPPELANGSERLVVNSSTPITPTIADLRRELELPYFVCVPVVVERRPIALLVAGVLRESKPLYPPLDQGDLDTFVAIAGFIAASIRNMRVGLLEEMDRLKTQFFANISHEFRTPITLTLGPLEQLLNGRYGGVTPDAREQLAIMHRNQARLLTLVNQILDLAKFEANEMRLRATRVPDVNRLVSAIVAQFETAAADRGLSLALHPAPSIEGADLYLDVEKIERLIVNLLSNALKFTKRGGIEITIELQDDSFRLTVSDSGIGIKEDQLPHIFDRFRQADGSESREYAGTGIGLALVKEIAEVHKGSVTAHSRFGEGTTFRVTIPLGRAHLDPSYIVEEPSDHVVTLPQHEIAVIGEGATDREGVERANREAEIAFDETRPTILYAEDNPDLRRHVRDLLRGTYNVFLAVDGRDALQKISEYHPELVISDEMMPNMSGRDLLRAMRDQEQTRSTPVIFLTARAGTEARIESLEAGADDYLAKPFNEGELLARVRSLLRARAQERRLEELNGRLQVRVEEQLAELLRRGELQRFVPRAVAERVLSGELSDTDTTSRRKITVLSAGVSGFAELTDQLEPEDLAVITNEFLREITAAAVRHGGMIDRLTVERITVFFGAPQELPPADQAWSAAQTALALRARLAELGGAWRRRGIIGRLELRIGLHTGYCTVGLFGGDALRSYTAVGTPVTIAALLEQDAAPGSIVCGAPTYVLIQDRVDAVPRGARPLRGMARTVESYELTSRSEEAVVRLQRLRDFSFMPR